MPLPMPNVATLTQAIPVGQVTRDGAKHACFSGNERVKDETQTTVFSPYKEDTTSRSCIIKLLQEASVLESCVPQKRVHGREDFTGLRNLYALNSFQSTRRAQRVNSCCTSDTRPELAERRFKAPPVKLAIEPALDTLAQSGALQHVAPISFIQASLGFSFAPCHFQ